MDKVKVLQCSITNTKSGVTQYILNNWEKIDHKRFQFDFITFSKQLDMQYELEAQGGIVYYVKNRAEDDLGAFEKEIREILSHQYDVIHLHTSYWKTLHLERLAREMKIPKIIIHAHNSAVFDDDNRDEKIRIHEEIKKNIDENIATDYWACSHTAANFLYGDRIPKEKIKIINNAIDVNRFKFNDLLRQHIRDKHGWSDKYVIGHVGRFSYQKNHEFMLALFKEIYKSIPNLQIVLVGKGKLENNIKQQVEDSGLSDIVYFAGAVDNIECWYNAMDLFLLPSRFEGFPIVLVETQTNGLRSIVSNTITKEVELSDLIRFEELNISKWNRSIMNEYNSTSNKIRNWAYKQVENGKFNIDNQILDIENEYSSYKHGGIK